MKSLRLLAAALLACTFAASAALACDAHKSAKGTSASAAANTKTAAKGTASGCTPEMAAACASNPAVASAMGCSPAGTTATAASASAAKPGKSAAKSDDCCMMKGSKTSTTAVTASSKGTSMDHCADAKSAVSSMSAGMKCSAHTNAVVHDCSACEDWVACEQEVRALGARAQVVSLKNGAMIVYTVDSPADVKTLQRVIAQRHEKMVGAFAGTSGKVLCDECKSLRGAMASGKLHREVVNVERGCMTLITSNDREVVSKIRSMTGQPVAMR